MIDPRAYSEERLIPPAPLPHVSRSSLKRVKDPLPPPTDCPHCRGPVELVSHREVYGREYGEWPYFYLCRPCKAYVGLHPHTDIPLGTLADASTREARKRGKAVFHAMIDATGMSRGKAYRWLAKHMGIPKAECHWGWLNERQCERAALLCQHKIHLCRPGGGGK